MKAVITVLCDPRAGEAALGRVFNALAAAHDFQGAGQAVALLLQGAEALGLRVITDNAVPGTSGLPRLAGYLADGYTVPSF